MKQEEALTLCLIVTPTGRGKTAGATRLDFEAVLRDLLLPAVQGAGLGASVMRSDPQLPKSPAFMDRFYLARFVVAEASMIDAALASALGARAASRPGTTCLLMHCESPPPPGPAEAITITYSVDAQGRPSTVEESRGQLEHALAQMRRTSRRPPLVDLLDGPPASTIERLKTDTFRRHAERYGGALAPILAEARHSGLDAVREAQAKMEPVDEQPAGPVVDLLLSYRATGGHQEMVELVQQLNPPLKEAALVQEQAAFALNRLGRDGEAEKLLKALLARRGPSSETLSLLGRIYKDRWAAGQDSPQASHHLQKAIDSYRAGFEADWRDAYPGINAVTLMELRDPPDPERLSLIPVVRFANRRRLETPDADYWDHATGLELTVLANDDSGAADALKTALEKAREPWQLKSTANNLGLIRRAREKRGEAAQLATEVESRLLKAADEL